MRRSRIRGRAALAAVAALAAIAAPVASAADPYADVPPSNQFYTEISILKNAHIATECAPTLFCPLDSLLRQEMAAWIDRGLGLVTRPGETFPAPVPNSKAEQASRLEDTVGNGFRGITTGTPHAEFNVNGVHALRLDPGVTASNALGGSPSNSATAGVSGATIWGGGNQNFPNKVTDDYGTVAGGFANTAGNNFGTVSDAPGATVIGGNDNAATNHVATLIGGTHNRALGAGSTVLGGNSNDATAENSFAAGTNARAQADGSFAWSDLDYANPFLTTQGNSFVARARGGFWLGHTSTPSIPPGHFLETTVGAYLSTGGAWESASDRRLKTNVRAIDKRRVLERLVRMPVTSWRYKVEHGVRHIGPTAQDFARAFHLGESEQSINTVDADGVAMAALQALDSMNSANDRDVSRLERQVARVSDHN